MRMKKTFTRKMGIGRLALPLWALALTAGAVLAAAGQAVGPVLSGSVSGSAGLTVEQAVVLDEGGAVTFTGVDTNEDALGMINDEGTSFSVAMEMHVGGTTIMKLPIENNSDAAANAMLELNVPAGVDVEVEDSNNATTALQEAQMTKNGWLLYVASGNTETLNITVSPKDDLMPGFYTISGRITQITG